MLVWDDLPEAVLLLLGHHHVAAFMVQPDVARLHQALAELLRILMHLASLPLHLQLCLKRIGPPLALLGLDLGLGLLLLGLLDLRLRAAPAQVALQHERRGAGARCTRIKKGERARLRISISYLRQPSTG